MTDQVRTLLVRMKARKPKQGYKAKTATYIDPGTQERYPISSSIRWTRVPEQIGLAMAARRQDPAVEDSPLLFEVCTDRQAQTLNDEKRRRELEEKRRREPDVSSARDLSQGGEKLPDYTMPDRPEAGVNVIEQIVQNQRESQKNTQMLVESVAALAATLTSSSPQATPDHPVSASDPDLSISVSESDPVTVDVDGSKKMLVVKSETPTSKRAEAMKSIAPKKRPGRSKKGTK